MEILDGLSGGVYARLLRVSQGGKRDEITILNRVDESLELSV